MEYQHSRPGEPGRYLNQLTTTIGTTLSDSPYRPPTYHELSAVEPAPEVDSPPILPFAQLGLRLLGVMLFVDGIGSLLGGLTQGLLQALEYSNAGYTVPIDPHSAGWVTAGVPHLLMGIYLIVGGNWVLLRVFTSSRHHRASPHESTDDIAGSETV